VRVSVVLCTYALDALDDFREAADSVLAQTHPDVELVVVVDGDEAVHERVESAYGDRDDVVIHCNDENRGLLASRNTGAGLASGDAVAFIDDDAVAREDWVARLVESYRAHDVPAVGGRMAPAWVAGRPAFLPAEFYWLVGVTHRGFADGPGEVRNTFGSNLSVRREAFRDVGGFDPAIGGRKGDRSLQGGETELCARLRAATGRGVRYNPDAVVAHKVFDYRTRPRWLVERAFWQGYSKRAMETLLPPADAGRGAAGDDPDGGRDAGDASGAPGPAGGGSTAEEAEFLRRLVTEFVPGRIGGLLRRPSRAALAQLLALVVLTAAVGAGYLYGLVRWDGSAGTDGTDGDGGAGEPADRIGADG